MDRREQIEAHFREIEAPLRRALSRFRLSAAELDDLVQGAVARLLQAKTDIHFSSPWQLHDYLYQAASSVHLDGLRKMKSRGFEEQLDQDMDASWDAFDTDAVIATWLESLSEEERRVALLRLDGATWDAVAAELGHASSSQSRVLHASAIAALGVVRPRGRRSTEEVSEVVRALERSAFGERDYRDLWAAAWEESDDWWRILERSDAAHSSSRKLAALRGLLVFTGFHPDVGTGTSPEQAQRLVDARQSLRLPASGWDDLAVADILTLGFAGRVEDARALALLLARRAANTNSQELLELVRDVVSHYGVWPETLTGIADLLSLYCESSRRPAAEWLRLAARVALERRAFDAAIRFATEAAGARRPAAALTLVADACMGVHDYDAARAALDRLERCFDYAEDWILARRAATELLAGDTTMGRSYLARALWIHRTYPTAAGARFIAECYAVIGRHHDARQAARRSIRIHEQEDRRMRPDWEVLADEAELLRAAIRIYGSHRDLHYTALAERLDAIRTRLQT